VVRPLTHREYANLLAFRTALRRFNRWSEAQAQAVGLTAAQHQLLLAVKGHSETLAPTIGEVADYLLLRHHSAVELVNRAEAGGLVERRRDPSDGRVVRLVLTTVGEERIAQLTQLHLDEIQRLAPLLGHLSGDGGNPAEDGAPAPARH
jgi:DNA-binding MarR family transcriptional regulator